MVYKKRLGVSQPLKKSLAFAITNRKSTASNLISPNENAHIIGDVSKDCNFNLRNSAVGSTPVIGVGTWLSSQPSLVTRHQASSAFQQKIICNKLRLARRFGGQISLESVFVVLSSPFSPQNLTDR